MHGNDRFTLRSLSGAELTDPHFLKETAAGVPTPAPLSQTKRYLQRQVMEYGQALVDNQLFLYFISNMARNVYYGSVIAIYIYIICNMLILFHSTACFLAAL